MQDMISADAQEGASAAYESKSILENIPKEDIEGPKITRPRSTREKAGMLQGMLQDWHNNTEEIQGAAVVSLEGLTLATHMSQGGITGEQLGVLTASIYKVGSKSVKALRRGMLEELYLRGGQGTIHLYVIGSKAILSVLARSDANMGMVHIESRELCKRVAQVLGH
jgi:predicted regulator of Ras-like GTPase activity (Roadblock/LC7/MglB family)